MHSSLLRLKLERGPLPISGEISHCSSLFIDVLPCNLTLSWPPQAPSSIFSPSGNHLSLLGFPPLCLASWNLPPVSILQQLYASPRLFLLFQGSHSSVSNVQYFENLCVTYSVQFSICFSAYIQLQLFYPVWKWKYWKIFICFSCEFFLCPVSQHIIHH